MCQHPIKSWTTFFKIEGENEHGVPYLDYVEHGITFPKYILGNEHDVSTLVLVIPDLHANATEEVLIVTNTFDLLYQDCKQWNFELGQIKEYLKCLK